MSLLIENAEILTMEPGMKPFKGCLLIEDNKIKKISKNINKKYYSIDKIIDAEGKLVMPGLINGHNHFEQSFILGTTRLFPGGTSSWIKEFKIPITKAMDRDDYYYSNILTAIQLIKNGVTTSMNSICQQSPDKIMEYGIKEAARAVEESGIRSILAIGPADKFEPEEFLVDSSRASDIIETSIQEWNHEANDRIRVWAGPAGIFSATEELWRVIKDIVDKYNVGIHTHIASFEKGEILKARKYGFLGPNLTGAHCVWLSPEEIKIMAESGMKVVHNPVYKLSYSIDSEVKKFGDGIAPILELVENNVTVGLGQDGGMGDTQDLFKEMRCLAFTQEYRAQDKTIFPPNKLLKMVTIENAKTMLWEEEIGSLKEGKKADLIIINNSNTNFYPKTHLLSNLVYQGGGYDVETVIINGKIVMEDRQIKTVNEKDILRKSNIKANNLLKRAGFEEYLL